MPDMLIDFPGAMAAVRNGAKISRVGWNHEQEYAMMRKDNGLNVNTLQIHRGDTWYTWAPVTEGDIAATDWIIIESNLVA